MDDVLASRILVVRACNIMADNEYSALLRYVYEFCRNVAAGSVKSADLILHCEPPLLKHCSDATGDF
jgi:hypothetical protein